MTSRQQLRRGKPFVNVWAIRRIVNAMPLQSIEADVREKIRNCCVPGASAEFIQRAEELALDYFRSVKPEARHALLALDLQEAKARAGKTRRAIRAT